MTKADPWGGENQENATPPCMPAFINAVRDRRCAGGATTSAAHTRANVGGLRAHSLRRDRAQLPSR